MLSRRAFVGAGVTLAALATSTSRAHELPGDRTPGSSLRVIFDRTLHAGRDFGVAAERHGATVDGVGTDLGGYWMSTLEPLLKLRSLTLAGLTAGAPLFCLELLCRDYGLRTVYRIEHRHTRDDRVEHILTGHSALAPWTHGLFASGADWAAHAAALATTGSALPRPTTAIELLDLADGRATQSLFTWVMQCRIRHRD